MGLFFSLPPPFYVPAWFMEQFFARRTLMEPIYSWVGSPGLKLKIICSLFLPPDTDWGHPPLRVSFCPIPPPLSTQLDRHVRASVLLQLGNAVGGSMKMRVLRCGFEEMKWESWENSAHLSAGITLCCHSAFPYILASDHTRWLLINQSFYYHWALGHLDS